MDIKDFQQVLSNSIQKVEDIYIQYSSERAKLISASSRFDSDKYQLSIDRANVSRLMDKYSEIETLEIARKNARITIKAAEDRMTDVANERSKFEKYRSKVKADIDKSLLTIINREKQVSQAEVNLRDAVADFNETKKKYIMTEGEASF